ncbi:hypothetical protein B0H17DRAFT_1132755 [Mycena rosella]|uniref:Uncharacterized protein n=1 Tax=Mycena rosella TaxID=1033263 RepID=A0AAD7DMJ4_MYCRO|nr:hypothetical protein B0H17DRAFT_1132755 [Mycena rosella]
MYHELEVQPLPIDSLVIWAEEEIHSNTNFVTAGRVSAAGNESFVFYLGIILRYTRTPRILTTCGPSVRVPLAEHPIPLPAKLPGPSAEIVRDALSDDVRDMHRWTSAPRRAQRAQSHGWGPRYSRRELLGDPEGVHLVLREKLTKILRDPTPNFPPPANKSGSWPRDRMQEIMNCVPSSTAGLDHEYIAILSRIQRNPSDDTFLDIVKAATLGIHPEDINDLLALPHRTVRQVLANMHSLLLIPDEQHIVGLRQHGSVHHAAFSDYLQSPARSGTFCTNSLRCDENFMRGAIMILSKAQNLASRVKYFDHRLTGAGCDHTVKIRHELKRLNVSGFCKYADAAPAIHRADHKEYHFATQIEQVLRWLKA